MIKKILFSISLSLVVAFAAYSQNAIPNPGLENWTSGNADNWGNINAYQAGSCTQATGADAHSGNSAAKLTSMTNVVFGTVPGVMATGVFNIGTQNFDGGVAFNLHPDSLTGWYKYSPVNGDRGSILGILSRWNGIQRDTIAIAAFEVMGSQPTYVRFKIEFNYMLSGAPDTIQVICHSGDAEVNNQLWIDDLGLVYNPTIGLNDVPAKQKIDVYPNPVSENLFIDMAGVENTSALIFDITGKKVASIKLNETINKINVAAFANGLYVYQLVDDTKAILKTGKFIVK